LSDKELAALWRITEKLGYPFGPLYQVLLFTGARKNEWAAARWNEIDLDAGFLTVPPERFKSNATHLIPLTSQVRVILTALPRLDRGDYVFSASLGASPIKGFQKAKLHIDALMKEDLAAAPPPWVTHDIRRTVRAKLASLRVSDIVAEMIIGHGRRGLQRVYDQHSYESEMREALELWAARLRSIVEPPPENVYELKARAK
jgi:integrase